MGTPAQTPDFIPDQSPDFIPDGQSHTASPPGAMSRFMEGAKAGTGGENALNTPIDPQHPIASNPMIPGAGVYRDIKAGNYAGAAGRIVGPAAELLPFLGNKSEPEPSVSQPSAIGTKVRAIGSVLAKEGISHIPVAGRIVERPSIGDYYRAITAKPEPPPPMKIGPPSTDQVPGRPYMPRPRALSPNAPAEPIPARNGLMLPAGDEPATPIPPVSQKSVGQQLERSLGAEPLKPNVPLRAQIGKAPGPQKIETVSPAKVESSVIQKHEYLPSDHELHVTTKSDPNKIYVYGDVSSDQADAFNANPSKGKAWADFKKGGSPLVAKIQDGVRTPVRPIIKSGDLNPDASAPQIKIGKSKPRLIGKDEDLTPILKKSIAKVKASKIGQ